MNFDDLKDNMEDKDSGNTESENSEPEIVDSEVKWFTVHVYSGSEKKVEKMISEIIRENAELGKFIHEIYTPIKKSSKVVRSSKSAKRVVKPKNLYPGYIFIRMKPDKEVLNRITDLPNVISFLGGKNPIPLKSLEEGELKQLREEGDKIVKLTAPFAVNDSVKIVSGPFSDFIGVVENVNEEKQRLKVVVTIFGRSTPVEVDFIDAQPV
ncbi:transcription termination/antitermination factor NusG [candidate division WOR-3 bacterium]|nr:transcription termination/antitermination factor NusG [candidate division WOR-3 bacterium]